MPQRFLDPLQIWHRLELFLLGEVNVWSSKGNGEKPCIIGLSTELSLFDRFPGTFKSEVVMR